MSKPKKASVEIGKKLRDARIEKRLSLEEVQGRMKVKTSVSMLSRIENGSFSMKWAKKIEAICDALGIPFESIKEEI